MRFENKIVVITGSSRNTGLGIAEAFLKEGAKVFINGSTMESTQKGLDALFAKGYRNQFDFHCDISNPEEVEFMFKKLKKDFGGIDVLVNNGVIQCCGYSFEDLPLEEFDKTIRTNLYGTFLCSQQAVRIMIEQKSGVIVNFSSNVSTRAIHKRTAYCASKGGVDALTRSMAIDLAPYGIRVNAVAPGYIYTDRWESLSEETAIRRRNNVPLGKEAHANDIADVVMFLASEESRMITGERLVVDGGTTAQHMPCDIDV
ncbi:MAG: SDR family oxidoreductase [Planctomycetia bacterium]|nr:SDR family oxidoreductase [Planctomycetia bacterium]